MVSTIEQRRRFTIIKTPKSKPTSTVTVRKGGRRAGNLEEESGRTIIVDKGETADFVEQRKQEQIQAAVEAGRRQVERKQAQTPEGRTLPQQSITFSELTEANRKPIQSKLQPNLSTPEGEAFAAPPQVRRPNKLNRLNQRISRFTASDQAEATLRRSARESAQQRRAVEAEAPAKSPFGRAFQQVKRGFFAVDEFAATSELGGRRFFTRKPVNAAGESALFFATGGAATVGRAALVKAVPRVARFASGKIVTTGLVGAGVGIGGLQIASTPKGRRQEKTGELLARGNIGVASASLGSRAASGGLTAARRFNSARQASGSFQITSSASSRVNQKADLFKLATSTDARFTIGKQSFQTKSLTGGVETKRATYSLTETSIIGSGKSQTFVTRTGTAKVRDDFMLGKSITQNIIGKPVDRTFLGIKQQRSTGKSQKFLFATGDTRGVAGFGGGVTKRVGTVRGERGVAELFETRTLSKTLPHPTKDFISPKGIITSQKRTIKRLGSSKRGSILDNPVFEQPVVKPTTNIARRPLVGAQQDILAGRSAVKVFARGTVNPTRSLGIRPLAFTGLGTASILGLSSLTRSGLASQFRLPSKTRTSQITDPFSITSPKAATSLRLGGVLATKQLTSPLQSLRVSTPKLKLNPSPFTTPRFGGGILPPIPPPGLPLGGGSQSIKGKTKPKSRKSRSTGSLLAAEFNIKGKRQTFFTGLEIRPIF